MAKKRSSPQKREREFQKRQRERKKADKAAQKRERRLNRDQQSTPSVALGEDGELIESIDRERRDDGIDLVGPNPGEVAPEPGSDSPTEDPSAPPVEGA